MYALFNNNRGLRNVESRNYGFNNELINRRETVYKDSPNYINNGIGFLVESVKNYAGTGTLPISRTDYDYDTESLLVRGTIVSHAALSNTYRGNLTKITKYKNPQAGTGTIIGTMKYDDAGNLVESIDPLGRHKYADYTDNYSDGVNRNTFAFTTKLTSPVADSTGVHGSNTPFETSTKYEFNTGLVMASTNANGKVTTFEYNDPLLRPTRVIKPNGSQVVAEYNDSLASLSVKIKSQMELNKWSESIEYVDAAGNSLKSQSMSSKGDVFVENVYDNMRQIKKSTNPFKQNEAKKWTENFYDDLGRIKETITPDGAKVETIYNQDVTNTSNFTSVIVKDEAGKQRRAIYDVRGRMIRVDEPNDANQLGAIGQPNQPTNYTYNDLGDLIQSTQGSQVRTFTYDSLSRILSSNNPENGLLQFTYDDLGNLLTRKDAKNVITTQSYDNLGRVIGTTYSDATPAVEYFYDDPTIANSKGNMTKVFSSVSETKYIAFDIQGQVLSSQQTTGGTTFNPSYYEYGLDGTLLKETYPSGRVVKKVYDDDGDLLRVFGKAANKGFQNYVSQFTYASSGAATSMMLGNGKWESTVYNDRLQATQLKLGNSKNSGNVWQVNFDYGLTDNNGNIKSQTIIVPTAGTANGFTASQNYEYDSLNRLKSATETIGSQVNWKQVFTYDRFGNRKFDEQQTTTISKTCGTTTSPQVCADDHKRLNPDTNTSNNRIATTEGYIYDPVGNLTQNFDNQHFSYNALNKMTEVRNSANTVIGAYLYDGNGKRVKKVSQTESITFVYNAFGNMIAEYSNATVTNPTPQLNYLTSDHLGSPRVITDSKGNVVSRRDFMPFGEEISSMAINRNQQMGYGAGDSIRQKFTTYERDTESELDFAQARYYNSKHGRFTSVDPLMASASAVAPQTWNRYAYVGNNPLNIVDPTGMDYFDGTEAGAWNPYEMEAISNSKPAWWYIPCNSCSPIFGTDYTADNIVRPNESGALVYPAVGGIWVALNPLANGAPQFVEAATEALAIAAGILIAEAAAVVAAWAPVLAIVGIVVATVAITVACGTGCPQAAEGAHQNYSQDIAKLADWLYGDDFYKNSGVYQSSSIENEQATPQQASPAANTSTGNGNSSGNDPNKPKLTDEEKWARKHQLKLDSPRAKQVVDNRDMKVVDFVGKFRQGKIWGVLSQEEWGQRTVREAIEEGGTTVRKMLTDNRWAQ
jgi:RHS repeat-associated protein